MNGNQNIETDREIMDLFIQLESLMHRYQAYQFRNRGPFANPMRGQGRVLALLRMQPEITQKDLSYLLDMRNQSLGELLSKLERSGYITRTPSEKDRRVMNVKLTQEGAKAADEMDEKQLGMENFLDCFTDDEKENLKSYLVKMIAAMDKHMEGIFDMKHGHGHGHDHRHFGKERGLDALRERMAGMKGPRFHGHGHFGPMHGFGGLEEFYGGGFDEENEGENEN